MVMFRAIVLSGLLLAVMAGGAYGLPTQYTGTLTGNGGGLFATGLWDSTITNLTWTVSFDVNGVTVPGYWHYDYTFATPTICGVTKNISHYIIEVSPTFTSDDLKHSTWGDTEVQVYGPNLQGKSDPDMPSNMNGIKFDNINQQTLRVQFDSLRAPVWGDFYAKDGTQKIDAHTHIDVYAYNLGFTNPDTDPLVGPSGGSVDYHLLVPDTFNFGDGGEVPEPVTCAALCLSFGGLAGYIRRRRAA